MKHEIIDFHTHPYIEQKNSICRYKSVYQMDVSQAKEYLQGLGICKICGSVLEKFNTLPIWSDIQRLNDEALRLKENYGDFYVPGFHVHAKFPRESILEIERMEKAGIKLVGELVPYSHGWDYGDEGFEEILQALDEKKMIVSFHSTGGSRGSMDAIDAMVARHPRITFVAAHPGENETYLHHLDRMEKNPNYYLDLSGTGLFRLGMLYYGIQKVGSKRFLFGTDFPVCDPAMYVGSIINDFCLSEEDKVNILYKNAQKLLNA